MNSKKNSILVVAAHPDDEILGCGGTISRLTKEGFDAYTLILGEGITSRDKEPNRAKRAEDLQGLKKQAIEANGILGVKKVFTFKFPDNRFDTVSLLDIVKVIEQVKKEINPHIVFTHYESDLNIDHQITYKAVLTATRTQPNESVKEIYSFEILSSTEWNFPTRFAPNVFFDISKTLELKLKAIQKYKGELRKFPHPRSLEGIRISSSYWGMKIGVECAEAFQNVRIIK